MTLSAIANCYRVKLKNDSKEILYCSGDLIITIDGIISKNGTGLFISEISNKSSQMDDDFELVGSYDDFFTKENLRIGLFEAARLDFFLYDYISQTKSQIIKRGFISEIELKQDQFYLKLQSLMKYLLKNNINNIYSRNCRAKFGDDKCKLNIKELQKTLGYLPSCDKTHQTCKSYNNLINFRGE